MSNSTDAPVMNKPGMRGLLKSGESASLRQKGEEQKKSDTAATANTEAPSDANKKTEPAAELLSSAEAQILAECEERIHGANLSFLQAGKALEKINVQRLYRERHKTFQAYCAERWGFTPQRADQLIRGSVVATAIADSDPDGKLPRPDSEGQLRPLTRLANLSEAVLVWEAATESAGGTRITARLLAAAIEDLGCELRTPAKAPPQPSSPGQVVKRINDFTNSLSAKVASLVPGNLSPDDANNLRQGIQALQQLIEDIEDRLGQIGGDGMDASTSEVTSG
jgi:hypothetical protein